MANFLAPILNDQQEDNNGAPLSGGTAEVYLAGTSTPATTFSDKAGLVPNTWPIVLNTLGVNNQGAVWLTGGTSYKFIIKNSVGVVQRTIDNVSGINDNTAGADQWVVFQATPTFVSTTSFTLVGDQTQIFQVGRRVKTQNTGGIVYGTITGSVFSTPNTTITIRPDSGVLDAGLSAVSYGLLSVSDTSLPGGLINYGQCRLVGAGVNVRLIPFNGNKITVGSQICLIPAAGVTLAPSGLTPLTLYYIYAFMSGATLTLEASTTVHAQDAVTGVEIKTGDPTRTLVGMARPIAGPGFVDTLTQRLVISWFNRQPINLQASLVSGTTNTSTGAYAILANTLLLEFLTWSGVVQSRFQGRLSNNTVNAVSSTATFLDGTNSESFTSSGAYATGAVQPVSCGLDVLTSEGFHNLQVYVQQDVASIATYTGGVAGLRCSHSAIIQG